LQQKTNNTVREDNISEMKSCMTHFLETVASQHNTIFNFYTDRGNLILSRTMRGIKW